MEQEVLVEKFRDDVRCLRLTLDACGLVSKPGITEWNASQDETAGEKEAVQAVKYRPR